MYVCMYVCTYVFMYVRMYVCLYSCSNSRNAERIFERFNIRNVYGKMPEFKIYWAELRKQIKQQHNRRNITIVDKVKEIV